MNNEELKEIERLLNEIERFKLSNPQVTRIQEILKPIVDKRIAEDERKALGLATAYMGYHVDKEVSKAINALSGIKTLTKLATDDLRRLNGEEQDILHALELTDLSLEELTGITGELKTIRINRRVTKNFLEASQPLHTFAEQNERMVKQLQQLAGVTRKAITAIDNRQYSVRQKTSLKEAFDNAEPLITRIPHSALAQTL